MTFWNLLLSMVYSGLLVCCMRPIQHNATWHLYLDPQVVRKFMIEGNAHKKTLELQKACVRFKKCSICSTNDVLKMSKYHLLPHKPAARLAVKKKLFKDLEVIVKCWQAWSSQQNKGVTKHWWHQNTSAKSPHAQNWKKGRSENASGTFF